MLSLSEKTLRLKLFLALTHLVNFFLDENKPTDVQTLSSRQSFGAKEEAQLQTLVLEGLREYRVLLCRSEQCLILSVDVQVLTRHSAVSTVTHTASRSLAI